MQTLQEQLARSRSEQERLASLFLEEHLQPTGEKSAFSVADVAELVAYLKTH